jgi:hypothetical protein
MPLGGAAKLEKDPILIVETRIQDSRFTVPTARKLNPCPQKSYKSLLAG